MPAQESISMTHYVFYSNQYDHSLANSPDDIVEYGIETKRSAQSSVGAQISFISGTGSPKQFRLCCAFIADGVESRDNGERGHRIYGARGVQLDPPVLLNQLPWFADLRRTQFHSLGLFEIRASKKLSEIQASGIVAGLEALAPVAMEVKEHHDAEGDVVDLADVDSQLADDIAESQTLSDSERAARLAQASPFPVSIEVYTTAFLRNADVIVEVLKRANGICAVCSQKAPFLRRSNGTPYLEVHHWKRISDGVEDTIENAAALCPNCHREAHYG